MKPIITQTTECEGRTTITVSEAASVFTLGDYVRIDGASYRVVSGVGIHAACTTLTVRPVGTGWRETLRAAWEDRCAFPMAYAMDCLQHWMGRR